ncbi:MAG: hypothetical protein OR994_07915 [Candidatus Poseidoniales archaeon]|jgi:hypothetical protein|nr:hypothetical protein [Candidatus Poseidoniales archaeon]|tara:strand:- start:1232 stop:1504 length:273 start_codon:yes stop_codon:yes gene_type:complete
MKQLISATLSIEAAMIYNNWEKQKKSSILSDLIVREEINRLHIEALLKQRTQAQVTMSLAIVRLLLKEGKTPLLEKMNDSLEGTIHYQYW